MLLLFTECDAAEWGKQVYWEAHKSFDGSEYLKCLLFVGQCGNSAKWPEEEEEEEDWIKKEFFVSY